MKRFPAIFLSYLYRLLALSPLILLSSCSRTERPITGGSEWDYPYTAEVSRVVDNNGSNFRVIPMRFDPDGRIFSVHPKNWDFSGGPGGRSEIVIHEGIRSAGGPFQAHEEFHGQRITDVEAVDISGDRTKELLVCLVEGTLLKLKVIEAYSWVVRDSFVTTLGHDFDGSRTWDATPQMCGALDCDDDGYPDVLINIGADRDRFPHALLAYSTHKRHVLWNRFFAAHLMKGNLTLADIDGDAEDEIVGSALTQLNPTLLKLDSARTFYFVRKDQSGECFGALYDADGSLIRKYACPEAESLYAGFGGEVAIEYSGACSYLFALEKTGREIWSQQIDGEGYGFQYRFAGGESGPRRPIAVYSYSYARDDLDSSRLAILDPLSGRDLLLSSRFPSKYSTMEAFREEGRDRILAYVGAGRLAVFDDSLKIIRSVTDDGLGLNELSKSKYDFTGSGKPEFAVWDRFGRTYAIDGKLRPLLRMSGDLRGAFERVPGSDIGGSEVPIWIDEAYAVLSVRPTPNDIAYYMGHYRWSIVGLIVLVNALLATLAINAYRNRLTPRDINAIADLLSEFEVGICLLNDRKGTAYLNRFLGDALGVPANRFISQRVLAQSPAADRLTPSSGTRAGGALGAFTWENTLVITGADHAFVWGRLPSKMGSLVKGFTTIICFDRTEFIQGRWASIWGLVAQQKLHKRTKAPKIQIDKYLSRIESASGDVESVARLREKIDDIMTLASDLLQGSQLDQPELEIFDIREPLKEIREANRDLTEDREIAIGLELPEEPLFVRGLRSRLHDALENVVGNALRALEGKGEVSISCRLAQGLHKNSSRDWAEIRVKDTGCGIAPEDLGRVFDRNFTRFPGGSGFGLTFARQVVENHGGKIELESKQGEYTIVRIDLPLHDGGD